MPRQHCPIPELVHRISYHSPRDLLPKSSAVDTLLILDQIISPANTLASLIPGSLSHNFGPLKKTEKLL
jgi:hypothetical protein